MINARSITEIDASRFSTRFRAPTYGSYNFSRIPGTVLSLLGNGSRSDGLPSEVIPKGMKPRKVVLICVDAFGWRFFEAYKEKFPLLQRFERDGVVSKMTSQFPSTTACHMTTLHTGVPVAESGVYEWSYYEPLIDDVITPLKFSLGSESGRDTLLASGVEPELLFPSKTLYSHLQKSGVSSYAWGHESYTPSTYSRLMFRGAALHPFSSLPSGLTHLRETVLSAPAPSHFFFYIDTFDSVCHQKGPGSVEAQREAEKVFSALESELVAPLLGKSPDTLLCLTADHGQVDVSPSTTIYLDKELPSLLPMLIQNRAGNPIVPAGSPRDFFLHIKPEYLFEAREILTHHLEGKAEVFPIDDLISAGLFGSKTISEVFRGRVGNLVILPYEGESVWWYGDGRYANKFFGHHGGLTGVEMDSLFMTLPL